MDKELINNLTYKLNNIGVDFKHKCIGKDVTFVIDEACSYFCRHYCRFDKLCLAVPDGDMPWCPLEELR